MVRKVAWILSILLLANTGALGLYNGARELADATTPLQRSVTIGVLIYGLMGVAATVALIARHASSVWLTVAWAAAITYVAGVASIAYGGADASVGGAIAAGVAAGLIGFGVAWCARLITRPAKLHDRVQGASEG